MADERMNNVKIFRAIAGLTQYDLSKATKIAAPRISLLERDLVSATDAELGRIAETLKAYNAEQPTDRRAPMRGR